MGVYEEVVLGTTMCATVVISACAVTAFVYCVCVRRAEPPAATSERHGEWLHERLNRLNARGAGQHESMAAAPGRRARPLLPCQKPVAVVVVVQPDDDIALGV